MIIKFDCPGCGHSLESDAEAEFDKFTCPVCQKVFFPKPLKTFDRQPVRPAASDSHLDQEPDEWVICSCNICSGKLEFDPIRAGETIPCPLCGVDTILFVPPNPQDPPPVLEEPLRPQTIDLSKAIIVTTSNEINGYVVENYLGIASGTVIRSPTFAQEWLAGLNQALGRGTWGMYAGVSQEARRQASNMMLDDARRMGADAVIAMRYDTTDFEPGVTEVLAYGTAVKLAKLGVQLPVSK